MHIRNSDKSLNELNSKQTANWIVLPEESEMAGIARYVGDYVGPHKVYEHLSKNFQLLVDTENKIAMLPTLGYNVKYETLNLPEDFETTKVYIQAVKRTAFQSVINLVHNDGGGSKYLEDELLNRHLGEFFRGAVSDEII